jgi:Ca-activated chloride channel family protein
LVEWVNKSLMRTRIFPIFPNERKVVELRMQSAALRTGREIRIEYDAGTRRGHAQPIGGAPISITLSYPDSAHYGVPRSTTHVLTTIGSRNGMRVVTATGTSGHISIALPVLVPGPELVQVLSHAQVGEPGYAMITVIPPPLLAPVRARDIVVALDVSGSMAGERIAIARSAARELLSRLSASDRFRIVTFADSATPLNDLVPATRRNIANAMAALNAVKPDGRTNTSHALNIALQSFASAVPLRTQLVLMISDGMPTRGELRYESLLQLVESLRGSTRVFTVGVGPLLTGELMRDIASSGDGAAFVAETDSTSALMVEALLAAEAPIITDVQLSTRGTPLLEIPHTHARNIYTNSDLVVFARYSGAGTATITVRGNTASGPVQWSQSVELQAAVPENDFVARAWATQRIAELDHQMKLGCPNPGLERDISLIAEKHAVPSPFTSYLVLEPGIQVDKDGNVLNARGFIVGNVVGGTAAAPGGVAGRGSVGRGSSASPAPRRGTNPASDVVIQIRNPLSIAGFAMPLIIIDGVIQLHDDPSLDGGNTRATGAPPALDLDPETIESIEVVRGAAAAALYGQRAANGVINITTKNPVDGIARVVALESCKEAHNDVQNVMLGLLGPCCRK